MFWLNFLKLQDLREGEKVKIRSREYLFKNGILRQRDVYSNTQRHTEQSFAFKWDKIKSYSSNRIKDHSKKWLLKKYLDNDKNVLKRILPESSRVLDAGCGSGFSTLIFLKPFINKINYLGIDISNSVDIAKKRFEEDGLRGEFLQADLMKLPFTKPTFNFIFSEGVLHHTDSTEKALKYLARLLFPGGVFLFYVYRKKAPIREFCDEHIRKYLKGLSNKKAWEKLKPLTKLGKVLGDLNIEIEIPEDIPYLEIPKGRVNLQRLFYWYFCKLYYKNDFSLDEMNHINFDWYRPLNCHRHTPKQIKCWCKEAGLIIERFYVDESGITCVTRKPKFHRTK